MNGNTLTTRRPTCRYLDRLGDRCTGEAVDPNGEIVLCAKHLGRALELIRRRTTNVRA